jgi:uncharacterized membrane protein
MWMFVAGLVLFFGLHLVALTPAARRGVVGGIGELPWKGIVSVGSLGAIVLISLGWHAVPTTSLFAPSALAIKSAPLLMSVALALFVIGGGKLPGHIRLNLHHPLLIGVALWAAVHLMANGSVRDTWLFGSFLVFAVYAFIALMAAGKRAQFVPSLSKDITGLVIGVVLAFILMRAHMWLFGVPGN